MPKRGYWNIWLGIGCESWLVENGWKRGPTSWLRSAELLGHRCLKVILQFCLFAPTSRYFSYTFIVTTLSDGLKYVTDLFKGRPSRHEGERGMGRSKWFATSQRPRVIAAMVKGKAWRKVISTENLFDNRARWLWAWVCPSRSWYLPPWSPSFCRPHQGTR